MKIKLVILFLTTFTLFFKLGAQERRDFDIVQKIIELEDLQDLKLMVANNYGNPDDAYLAFPDDENKKDIYTFVYNLPGENFTLNLIVYQRSYIFAATLVYPERFQRRINKFLDNLDFRQGKYYKPDTQLFFQSYSSTDKVDEEFHILQIVEEVD